MTFSGVCGVYTLIPHLHQTADTIKICMAELHPASFASMLFRTRATQSRSGKGPATWGLPSTFRRLEANQKITLTPLSTASRVWLSLHLPQFCQAAIMGPSGREWWTTLEAARIEQANSVPSRLKTGISLDAWIHLNPLEPLEPMLLQFLHLPWKKSCKWISRIQQISHKYIYITTSNLVDLLLEQSLSASDNIPNWTNLRNCSNRLLRVSPVCWPN